MLYSPTDNRFLYLTANATVPPPAAGSSYWDLGLKSVPDNTSQVELRGHTLASYAPYFRFYFLTNQGGGTNKYIWVEGGGAYGHVDRHLTSDERFHAFRFIDNNDGTADDGSDDTVSLEFVQSVANANDDTIMSVDGQSKWLVVRPNCPETGCTAVP